MIETYISTYAINTPSKPAFVISGVEYSYQQLDRDINRVAHVLLAYYHVKSQDRVILRATRSYGFLCCYFALHRINAIVLPADEEISEATLSYIQKSTRPVLLIGDREGDDVESSAILNAAVNEDSTLILKEPTADSVADIMFTSGTTGDPKGVMLTHKNILASAMNMSSYIGNGSDDIEVLALPLCHSFGLGRIRSTMLKGGTVYLHDGFSNVKSLFKLIESSHATGFSMVPAGWRLIQRLSGNRISKFADQLKYIEMGSSFLSEVEKRQLADLLPNTRICMHYGLTEASRSAFLEFHGDHLDSVGKALPYVDIIICEDGKLIKQDGVVGEICVAGEHVVQSYWGTKKNDDLFFNGYLRTGDLGCFKDGYLYIVGRLKDVINVGGKKVSATEIEAVANAFEGVIESACVAEKESVMGEVPKLYVVADSTFTIENLETHLRNALEEYKQPHSIELIKELPKTQNGKIQKYKLQ